MQHLCLNREQRLKGLGVRKNIFCFLILGCSILIQAQVGLEDPEEPEITPSMVQDSSSATNSAEVTAPLLWMDLYSEGVYDKEEERNTSGFMAMQLGKRFDFFLPIDIYGKAHFDRDIQNKYWNNRTDLGFGYRISFLQKMSLQFFQEIRWGQYLRKDNTQLSLQSVQNNSGKIRETIANMENQYRSLEQQNFYLNSLGIPVEGKALQQSLDSLKTAFSHVNSSLDSLDAAKDSLQQVADSIALIPTGTFMDIKTGLVFWTGWGKNGVFNNWIGFPFRFWGDVYAEGIFSFHTRKVLQRNAQNNYQDSSIRLMNFVFYVNPDLGFVMAEGKWGMLINYATAYASYDTHRDWWNRKIMGGPGIRWEPASSLNFALCAEYLWGNYFGENRTEDPNPNDKQFTDLRLSANFWYGLGI